MPHRLTDVVRRAAGLPGRDAVPDRDLLGRFVADRDSDAFAELVRRHGAMVRGVCRRTLGNTADADDACQAAFLILARRAASVRRADAVGSWLYGVARRVAWKARQRRKASRERERPVDLNRSTVAYASGSDGASRSADLADLLALLDEELARLPDAYRAPLILCYLEGRTQDEAARQLGWSLGAFRGRLERGRARLRVRLDRRGVGLAVLAAATAESVAGAVPAGIVTTIVTTATGEAGAVPAAVAALAAEVMRAMTMSKLQWAAGIAAVCGLLTVGGLWATGQGLGGKGGVQPPAATVPPAAALEPPAERTADASQRRKSLNNLKQIMLTIINYEVGYKHLPADIRSKDGKPLLSWRVAILPWMEEDRVYRQFHLNEPWDSEHNKKLLALMPAVYRVGFEPEGSTDTYYQVFAGPGAPLNPADGSKVSLGRLAGGASHTLGVLEAGPPVPWTKPADLPYDQAKPLPKLVGPFANVLHLAAMDGSCYALRRDIPKDVFRRMISKDNREETPPLSQFEAVLTAAEVAKEVERVRGRIKENQQFIDRIPALMKEHAELLAGQASKVNDLDAAEGLAEHLKEVAERLTERNRKLRDERRAKP